MTALRVLLALLAGCAVLLGLPPAPSAQASEPRALVRVTLTAMTPALPDRDGTIELRGRVENVTEERLHRLQAIFWRNLAPITSAEGLQQALQSESNVPLGNRYTPVYQDLYAPDDPYLEPGATVDFALTVDVADLQLSPADGVFLVGVHVLQDGSPTAVGRARTFAPVLSEPPATSLRMTSLVVLSSRPSQLRRGVLADDHLAQEIRPGGRLAQLLAAADSDQTSFAVDPALIEELSTMRGGYSLQTADGATADGPGEADAADWLSRFAEVRDRRDGYSLLYGSPDVVALVRGGQTAVLEDAAAAGQRVEATAGLPLLVMPGDGFADDATLRAVAELDPAAVLLSDTAAIGDGPLLAGPGGTPVVRFGSTSSRGGPGPRPRNTPVQVRQRVLADTWLQASDAPDGVTRGRVRLVTATNQISQNEPGVEAPWMSPATLSDLLSGTPAPWDGELVYPQRARDDELTGAQLASLGRLAESWSAYREVLGDGSTVERSGQAALARAASVGWRNQERHRRSFVQAQQATLDAALKDSLRISTTPKVSTVAREGVVFPITIENLLPVDPDDPEANAVRLRLVFESENRQRLTIAPIEAGLIRAGERYTANAQVTAKANGTVVVRAQLQSSTGTPVGRPQTIEVRVTQNGTTGWAIAAAALVVFGGSTALRIRQVSRSGAKTATTPTTASALTSAPAAGAPPTARPEPSDLRDD